MTFDALIEKAKESGIEPGTCPACKAGLVPSLRVSFARNPHMAPNVFSFDCPNSPDHIEDSEKPVYFFSRK